MKVDIEPSAQIGDRCANRSFTLIGNFRYHLKVSYFIRRFNLSDCLIALLELNKKINGLGGFGIDG
jgi:hypothetical protein